jgi:hypothetical protein
MKVNILKPVEVNVCIVNIDVPVHYGDEDIPFDAPRRNGDMWRADVVVDSGQIRHWPEGKELKLHMKVCDSGVYTLYNEHYEVITVLEDYVPHSLIPGSWGDYIELDIDQTGKITNWPKNPSLEDFDLEIK